MEMSVEMAKNLTGSNVQEILQGCRNEGVTSDHTEGTESYFDLPPQLGRGYWRENHLCPGLSLMITNLEKRQNHIHQIYQHPQPMPLTASFYLNGSCRVTNDSLDSPQEEVAGKNYLYCLPSTAETEEYKANQPLQHIRIQISSSLLKAFGLAGFKDLPSGIERAIAGETHSRLYHASKTTPAMQSVLNQLIHCPYQGATRQLYLEGKILELLALQLNQLMGDRPHPFQTGSFCRSDLDQIHLAKDVLIQNFDHPPSLLELARQVNLNERKLKQGFRQVFGTTVFGYLHDYRMSQAHQLVLAGHMTVQDIARCVGYASRPSFVAAFKRKYNASPTQLMRQHSVQRMS